MHFIYVMNEHDRDVLEKIGFSCLKEKNGVFIFENSQIGKFSTEDLLESADISLYVLSDVLTF